jgi:hypothetical protein
MVHLMKERRAEAAGHYDADEPSESAFAWRASRRPAALAVPIIARGRVVGLHGLKRAL